MNKLEFPCLSWCQSNRCARASSAFALVA